MSNPPLVSVVIPCYNHEKYVKQSLDSVLNQTYNNIELIVVDDGSSDNSVTVVNKILKEHDFTFITQKNMGVCKALNKGVSLSKGKYVAILASDDYWDLTKVEKQVNCLENNTKSEFCSTQAIEFDDQFIKKNMIFPKRLPTGNVLNKVFYRPYVPAGSIMFTRRLYNILFGFDDNLKAEDWDFVIRSAVITEFSAVEEPLLYYRSHETNISKTRQRKDTFRLKVMLLTKNIDLVSPWRWYVSISAHFAYDIILKRGR